MSHFRVIEFLDPKSTFIICISFNMQCVPSMNDYHKHYGDNCSPCDPREDKMHANVTMRGKDLVTERH